MSDIENDVAWFRDEIQVWEDFRVTLYDFWGRISQTGELPEINERFPDALREVVPDLNSARQQIIDNFYAGKDEMKAVRDTMEQTAEAYISTEAANEDEAESLREDLEG